MGQCGGLDCFSHRLHSLFPPPQFRPDSGVSPHSLEARVWHRVWGLLLDSPCAHHGAGSVLESLTWSQEHPALPVLAAFHIQTAGCWGQPLPSLLLGCSLDAGAPTPVGQGSIQGLPDTAPGVLQAPPFPPSPAPRAAPVTLGQSGHSKHSPGFQRCPSSSLSFNPQGRGGSSRSSHWSCASSTLGWHV